jgi:hypothetical protein
MLLSGFHFWSPGSPSGFVIWNVEGLGEGVLVQWSENQGSIPLGLSLKKAQI